MFHPLCFWPTDLNWNINALIMCDVRVVNMTRSFHVIVKFPVFDPRCPQMTSECWMLSWAQSRSEKVESIGSSGEGKEETGGRRLLSSHKSRGVKKKYICTWFKNKYILKLFVFFVWKISFNKLFWDKYIIFTRMCPLIWVLSDRVELGAVQGYFGRSGWAVALRSLRSYQGPGRAITPPQPR